MTKFRKSEIEVLANKLTCNSELFKDEVDAVICQLTSLSNSANEFGCPMEGKISDCWGSSVTVVAMPDKFKHSWNF